MKINNFPKFSNKKESGMKQSKIGHRTYESSSLLENEWPYYVRQTSASSLHMYCIHRVRRMMALWLFWLRSTVSSKYLLSRGSFKLLKKPFDVTFHEWENDSIHSHSGLLIFYSDPTFFLRSFFIKFDDRLRTMRNSKMGARSPHPFFKNILSLYSEIRKIELPKNRKQNLSLHH